VREERGLTQEQLGALCGGMDLSYISRIERGQKDLQLTTIVRVACGLGIAPSQLIEDVTCPEPGGER
jgi:transcriptional regulator with XRE-family HTH domain